MKREMWVVANTFAYAIRILNSIFCDGDVKLGKDRDGEYNEKEYNEKEMWLVAEQVNSMCSEIMIEDVEIIIAMIKSLPIKRLCEKTDCFYHHPIDYRKQAHEKYIIRDLYCCYCSYNKKYKDTEFQVDNYCTQK